MQSLPPPSNPQAALPPSHQPTPRKNSDVAALCPKATSSLLSPNITPSQQGFAMLDVQRGPRVTDSLQLRAQKREGPLGGLNAMLENEFEAAEAVAEPFVVLLLRKN